MTDQENTNLISSLNNAFSKGKTLPPAILTHGGNHHTQATDPKYEDARIVRNTKFNFRPGAIILVETIEQVKEVVRFVRKNNSGDNPKIELRVRSGGHDHEGECSGTDTWVIDFRKMNTVEVLEKTSDGDWLVAIEPGADFERISSELNHNANNLEKLKGDKIAIPHGTCQSVAVAGYTFGGGWGPWTRKYGMACERLIGATIVLGDGTPMRVKSTDPRGRQPGDLLWALRGGGGFSYGIVTELLFRAVPVPNESCTVKARFNYRHPKEGGSSRPAREIAELWLKFVQDPEETRLLGTNLLIRAQNQRADQNAALKCIFNGYFEGNKDDIAALVREKFGLTNPEDLVVTTGPVEKRNDDFQYWEIEGGIGAVPEKDRPHKITSRLATQEWDGKSFEALIYALQSDSLVAPSGKDIDQYVTLGAITGPFYSGDIAKMPDIAFPYRNRLFTVQFQAWWNPEFATREWANRAEDWIDDCRHAKIPRTVGSFISFKDGAVPTRDYFAQNYEELKMVKKSRSEDDKLLFKTRKTII